MAITLKRQLTDEEKDIILQKYGRKCYITGHIIPENETVHFDHIKAFSKKGVTDLDNIAPMCSKHNQEKGTLSLYDFKIKLEMQEFFSKGDALTLKDELMFLKKKNKIKGFGQSVYDYENINAVDKIKLEIDNKKEIYDVHTCPTTNLKYFYAKLPISVIDSDDDRENEIGLQPRYLIFDKVFRMFQHFQTNPVLQPSIGRLHNNKILIFDGQHKIASLLWNGRQDFECKIYIEPDARLLNQANISAHDKFNQTRFYSSIIMNKLGSQFGKDFEDYKNASDSDKASELGFCQFLQEQQNLTKAEINKRFRSFLYNSVINSEENKLSKYVSKGNRSTNNTPLTMDALEKSILKLLYKEPLDIPLASEKYIRAIELDNMIYICNLLYDFALVNWEKDVNKENVERMFRSRSIMSWSQIFYGAVCGTLDLDDPEDRQLPLFRKLSDEQKQKIEKLVKQLVKWNGWEVPVLSDELDRKLSDNVKEITTFFKEKGLTTGFLMGAPS